jgi:hypothetical protein
MKKNLNFPFANLKWYIGTMGRYKDPPISIFIVGKKNIENLNIGPTIPLENYPYVLLI